MKLQALAPAVALVCAATLSAQTVQRISGPLTPLELDAATGRISPGAFGSAAADVPTTTFANVSVSGFFATPPAGQEWVDWGAKAGGLSTVVCKIEYAYGTTAVDPSLGGPGAALEVAVYQGTVGNCTPGEVASQMKRLTLSGLPGSLDGKPAGYVLTVNLSNKCFYLTDGPIGWGYTGVDGVSGPLLITVGVDPTATVDAYDRFAPAPAPTGTCQGTFSFLTPGIASFYLRLEEDDGTETGSQTVRLGTGVNLGVLSPAAAPPKIGQTWTPSITTPAVASPLLDFIAISTISTPPIPAPGIGEILIGLLPPNPALVVAQPVGGGSPFHIAFPLSCNFVGLNVTSQAGQVGSGGVFGLTDALDFTIGI